MWPSTPLLSLVTLCIALVAGCSASGDGIASRAAPLLRERGEAVAMPSIAVPPQHQARTHPTLSVVAVAAPRFEWLSLGGRHWQIASPDRESPEVTDRREGTRGACPAGMVWVSGAMKLGTDRDQLAACDKWLDRDRCQSFNRETWLALSQAMPTRDMHYCIDRFEFPNVRGQYPAIYASPIEASELCRTQGKRLCTEDEWTFACEGEEATPYGYGTGYERDANVCIADRDWKSYDPAAMAVRDSKLAALEVDRLWQGKPSGSQPGCRSGFGVYDMTGNVDEWTTSTRNTGQPSILKGGYWGPVRARCRPSTRSHGQAHKYYQQGFRCCADSPNRT